MKMSTAFFFGILVLRSLGSCQSAPEADVPITSPEDEIVMTMSDWVQAYNDRDTATVGKAVVDSILVHAADGRHVWVTRQGLNKFLIETPEFSWEPLHIEYAGSREGGKDVVVVQGHEQRTYPDGRVFDEYLAEFFEWKDGRIVEVTQYARKP
jgi:hypothetical protein